MSGLPSGEVPDIYCQGVSRLIDAGKTDDAACLATCSGISNCNIAVTIQTSSQVECYGFQTCSGSTAPNSVTDSRTIRWYRKTAGGHACANGYSGNTDQGTPPGSYVGRSCNANIALARAHARAQLSLSCWKLPLLPHFTSLHFTPHLPLVAPQLAWWHYPHSAPLCPWPHSAFCIDLCFFALAKKFTTPLRSALTFLWPAPHFAPRVALAHHTMTRYLCSDSATSTFLW